MEEIKISEDVFQQIKDFDIDQLTKEQQSLIDKLILNKELNERYRTYGLCKECMQPNAGYRWCQLCNGKRFQRNFQNWTSGNNNIDELVKITQLNAKSYKEVVEWIEYDRFENIEYLDKVSFGTTFKATWKDGYIEEWNYENNQWKRYASHSVALKCLDKSQDITEEFLREVECHVTLNGSSCIIRLFGITKDPKTNNFMMVTQYAEYGSLRQHLNNSFNLLTWGDKLYNLHTTASGLADIHDKQLVHHDFHCGNILSIDTIYTCVTGLGLCRPANKTSDESAKRIYGVLPYVAPEVLRGKEYTQASDIYGFGIIAYEVCTGYPPYHDIVDHDESSLAIRICNGQRPSSNYKIPQLVLDVINQCWDADPLKRPKASELMNLFLNLWRDIENNNNSTINEQIKEADNTNKNLPTSRPKSDKRQYSGSTKIDFTDLNTKDENN